jgi:dihydropyrimidinase
MKVTGEPVSVLLRGEFIIREKQFVGKPGSGQYLKREKYSTNAPLNESETLSI